MGSPEDLLASVIVPVRNAGADLPRLLEALRQQSVPRDRFEVIVGDDGSTDNATRDLEGDGGWVRVTRGPAINAYAARNRAVSVSRGPVLAFIDADCRPERDWLERGLSALATCDVAAGGIRFDVPERPTVWALLDVESTKDHERQVRAGTAETANLFLSRALFDRVGPFDTGQPGWGDFEFVQRCVRSGARLAYAPDAQVRHPTRDGAASFLRNLWSMNASYGQFEGRAGRRPIGVEAKSWIPVVPTFRARRRAGLAPGLDRRRLGSQGVRIRARDALAATTVMYLVIPYLRCVAQTQGWLMARRDARR